MIYYIDPKKEKKKITAIEKIQELKAKHAAAGHGFFDILSK
jgi:hypothetical protein